MPESVVIPKRFNGPPKSGHGGYVAGIIAEFVGGPAEVTLRMPPPLETPLSIEHEADGVVLRDDQAQVVAVGARASLDLDIPEPPDPAAVADARDASPRLLDDALFPGCFACGAQRAVGDGLRIFAGPVEGSDLVAAPWKPDPSLAEDDGPVADRFIWAALDCPTVGAIRVGGSPVKALLGRICCTISNALEVDETATIIAWHLGSDGRKHYSAGALFSEAGDLCAYTRTTWIEIR